MVMLRVDKKLPLPTTTENAKKTFPRTSNK